MINSPSLKTERIPIGGIVFALSDISMANGQPTGFLPLDGRLVSRVEYSSLFSLIGTIGGAGDGSTTFNLPDLRGHVLMASGNHAGLTSRSLGDKIGVESVALTEAEMPSHNHDAAGTGGETNFDVASPAGGSGATGLVTGNDTAVNHVVGLSSASQIAISNKGGGLAHQNIQPSYVAHFFVRAR